MCMASLGGAQASLCEPDMRGLGELCVGEVEKRKLLSWSKAHVRGKAPWTVLGGIRGKRQRILTWEKAHLDLF